MRYIAVCSCGKDSLAMVLRLIEQKEPLDEVVFYDTGMEFGAIYRNWDRLCAICKEHNIKTVRLHPDIPFEEKAFEITVKNKDGSGTHKGYSWCGGRCRWGTTDKLSIMDRYCETEPSIVYVGIAADEPKRIEKERKPYKVMPLVTWGMTEDDCLAYCRERVWGWTEESPVTESGIVDLYDILDRVSCWCCSNKNQKELRNIFIYLPQYWAKLKDFQSRTCRPMKKYRRKGQDYGNVFELEQVFKEELENGR